ncbi:uncharacterized protein LOC101859953 [Aplysia californica]|uniref:Uncharacterized protein LOC101859953 n=1 Tax=Aplysia californica TaxID=6500 RepID=A0ABM0JWJ6_APLCA|nr:uncharacterized protein LOC101859953 [Aplysia californica]
MSYTQEHRDQLESRGWTVVPAVVSEADCDRHQADFRKWLSGFTQWPQSRSSMIWRYKSGHLAPAWEVRLAAKDTFAQIWGTTGLLSSMDGIAIGRAPEHSNDEAFWEARQDKFRSEQTAEREGLHAYQGMVNLEHCEADDWTYEVLEGSHKHYDNFMESSQQWHCTCLKPEHIAWFEEKGCSRKRVACPKGGMLVCDARLFRANARPTRGRANPGRWRFLIFVCMTPASWATDSDLAVKRKAYENLMLTKHWPSQKIELFRTDIYSKQASDPYPEFTLPEVACTGKAKKLAGVMAYSDNEEDPEFRPTWNEDKWGAFIDEEKLKNLAISQRKLKKDTGQEAE